MMNKPKLPPFDPMLDMTPQSNDRKFVKRLILFYSCIWLAFIGFVSYIWIDSGQMSVNEVVWVWTITHVITFLILGGAWWVAKASD